MKYIIDGSGGDLAPKEIVKGAVESLDRISDMELMLVGVKSEIESALKDCNYTGDKIEIIDAPEIIINDEDPLLAIRNKKNSSLVIACKMLKEGYCDGFLSAGSTGALLAGATLLVGRIEGFRRAFLPAFYPTKNKNMLLCDVGANVDVYPEDIVQFAQAGALYCKDVLNIENPKIGLINIGSESKKGNKLSKEAFSLLSESGLNFYGNIEPRYLTDGIVDVAVCDGFVGNVLLKTSEGVGMFLMNMLKDAFKSTFMTKIAALIMKKKMKQISAKFDYRIYGGVPLLGVKKVVMKAHGSSDSLAIVNAIIQMDRFAKSKLLEKYNY